MAGGRVRHWKHGWIPISPEAKAYVAGKGPRPVTGQSVNKQAGDLISRIKSDGGFTLDPRKGALLEVGKVDGFAVAIPGTEQSVGKETVGGEYIKREDFARGLAKVIAENATAIAKGAMIGGWYSPDRNEFMVELTDLVPDKDAAVQLGKERNQEAIFDMKTGEMTVTGGTGDSLNQKVSDDEIVSTFVAAPTAEELASARYYTGPGYTPLNNSLRFGEQRAASNDYYLQQLDALIGKSVVQRDQTVFRGVQSGSWLPMNMEPGQIIEDKGFVSTASDPKGRYAGDTKMVIRVPKGANALDLFGHNLTHHENEAEVLLPRGTKLRVISDVTGDPLRVINAEVVIDE